METMKDADKPKAVYKVKGKHIFRASLVPTQMGVSPSGAPVIVDQPGPMTRIEVGALLTDVRDDEVAAFGDRLELLSEEEVVAAEAAAKAAEQARQEAEVAAKVQAADVAAAEAEQKAVEAAEAAKVAQQRADATKDQATRAHRAAPTPPPTKAPEAEPPGASRRSQG